MSEAKTHASKDTLYLHSVVEIPRRLVIPNAQTKISCRPRKEKPSDGFFFVGET
jgi:hypothetical protein